MWWCMKKCLQRNNNSIFIDKQPFFGYLPSPARVWRGHRRCRYNDRTAWPPAAYRVDPPPLERSAEPGVVALYDRRKSKGVCDCRERGRSLARRCRRRERLDRTLPPPQLAHRKGYENGATYTQHFRIKPLTLTLSAHTYKIMHYLHVFVYVYERKIDTRRNGCVRACVFIRTLWTSYCCLSGRSWDRSGGFDDIHITLLLCLWNSSELNSAYLNALYYHNSRVRT